MDSPSLPKVDLHKVFDNGAFDHAVICTYTFDPKFFEEYCLENLETLHSAKNISVLLDRGIYDEILSGPQTARPKSANLRYLLHPVCVPGVFHSKIALLASPSKGRLVIGSANFSRAGLTSNAELVATFEFKVKERERHLPLFRAAYSFIEAVARRSNSRSLHSNLLEIEREAKWLIGDEPGEQLPAARLLSNLELPLLDQLVSLLRSSARCVSIMSRYFDEDPAVLEAIASKTGAAKIKIYTQNSSTWLSPEWLKCDLVKSGRVELYLTTFSSDRRSQTLHGKAFAFETDKHYLFAYGSANCTTAALLKSVARANLEVLLSVQVPQRIGKALIPQFFDPEKKAMRLLSPDQLFSERTKTESGGGVPPPIEIQEAELDGGQIILRLRDPLEDPGLHLKLEFASEAYVRLPVKADGKTTVVLNIAKELEKRLGLASAVVHIEGQGDDVRSNRVLISNLQDLQTGANSRKQRFLREAEQSAQGLLSVLSDLKAGSDEQALRTFLAFCDIPLSLAPRVLIRNWEQKPKAGDEGMRSLGAHNFRVALSLHDLVLTFSERHFRKLRRHISERAPNGISNFLHIFLAIGGILQSQIERAIEGLQAHSSVTPDEWADMRKICGVYFSLYRELATMLWEQYLSKLIKEFPAGRIRQEFEPELQPLTDLGTHMMRFREQIEKLRVQKCVMSFAGNRVVFGYFDSVLSDQRWPSYSRELNEMQGSISRAILGSNEPTSMARSAT